jgi:peroxiredoxin Q/BCP
MRLAIGDEAPEFVLPDEDGEEVALASLAGKRVVVFFYPADGTPGCTKEVRQFDERLADFERAGVEVIGISPDSAASHRRFREANALRVRLLCDPEHQVMESYGAYGEKMLYGRKSVGVIRSTFLIGGDARIARPWYGVRADGHAARVLEEVLAR